MLNRVLSNISEEELDSGETELTDTYHKLIRNFINTIKEEIEDSHNWSCMRRTCTSTVTGGNGYSSNFQYAAADIPSNSRLARMPIPTAGCYKNLMFDVTDSGDEYRMIEMDLKEIVDRLVLNDEQVAEPAHFALDPSASAVVARVHPIPVANRSLQGEFYVPQDSFVGDSNDIDTSINLPPGAIKALELGATWFALEERGEELGTNVSFAEQRYRTALDTAINRDDTEGSGNDYDLVPV
jgi:hypothetical protein